MSTAAIKAGSAFIEMFIKDNTKKGLSGVSRNVGSWATTLGVFGAGMAGFGASIVGSLTAAAFQFADAGGALMDLSAKTGVSVEALGELGYAAEQDGAKLETMKLGLQGIARFSGQLANGNKVAAKTLSQLGVSASEFMSLSPDQKMYLLADALKGIDDPSQKAALAMKVMGKAGVELLPVLKNGSEGLRQQAQRAHELGIILTTEQAKTGKSMGDAWLDVKLVLGGIVKQLGAAVVPMLTDVFNRMIEIGKAVVEFVKANQQLIVIAFKIGVALTVVGTALTIIGGLLIGGVMVVSAIATAWGWFLAVLAAVKVALLAIFSPVGLVIAGVVALAAAIGYGVYAFLRYTQAGQRLASAIGKFFGDMFSIVKRTLGGIFDALMTGNWALAGEVLMAGLNAAFQRGMLALKSMWAGFKQWLLNLFLDLAKEIISAAALIATKLNDAYKGLAGKDLPGMAEVDKVLRNATAGADGAKAAWAKHFAAEMAAAEKPFEQSLQRLNAAVEAASAARKRAADEQGQQQQQRFHIAVFGVTAANVAVGEVLSSAAVLLGRARDPGQAAEERTADAVEKFLPEIAKGIDDIEGGMAFA